MNMVKFIFSKIFVIFSQGNPSKLGDALTEKTIMMVGATGAGKSTLIDGFINYIVNVEWGDDFRFSLVDMLPEEAAKKSEVWYTKFIILSYIRMPSLFHYKQIHKSMMPISNSSIKVHLNFLCCLPGGHNTSSKALLITDSLGNFRCSP